MGRGSSAACDCSACGKRLPRSAFAKAELNRGGAGRCRDCLNCTKCKSCEAWCLQAQLNEKWQCRSCQENLQIDRLLKTPKDEVTHFGVEHVLKLEREAEYEMLLVCYRCGVFDRQVMQRILDFLRIPFVTSQNGMHFCELCDETFLELNVIPGQHVHMSASHWHINWAGCPGPRLLFNLSDTFTVVELMRASNDRWFFRTRAAPRKLSGPDCEAGSQSEISFETDDRAIMTTMPQFESFWAPLDATLEGKQSSPLSVHLSSKAHQAHEEAVMAGHKQLISRAAIKLAKELGEDAAMTFNRFQSGLGLRGRFCEPKDVQLVAKLERVRDAGVSVKFLREIYPGRHDFVWITPEELCDAEQKYSQQKQKRGSRK